MITGGMGKRKLGLIGLAILGVACISVPLGFGLKPLQVMGNAMAPTLVNGDMILTSTRVDELGRGDIIVFRYPKDPVYTVVMRIVALPGETVYTDENGQVYINGGPIDEPYALTGKGSQPVIPETTMGAHEYWVMGDNRANSQDSREWGPVPKQEVRGKIIWRYWPLTRTGVVE